MANVKITDLAPATTPLAGTELLEIVQSTNSRKVAASDIAATATNVRTVATGGTGAATLTGYVKGNGTSAMTASATIPYADLAGRAYISAYSTSDQTGSTSAATAVIFGATSFNSGITMENDALSNKTRITFAVGGTYMVAPSVQFKNSDSSDHDVTVWFRRNGTNIANSATVITVPKAADGGAAYFQIVFYEQVSSSDYIEVMWLPENTAVTLDYTAAGAIAPAIPSAIVCSERIA